MRGIKKKKDMLELESEYELLGKEFMGRSSQRGWSFRQIKREGLVCLYEKVDSDTGFRVYEVIEVQLRKGMKGMFGGKEVEFKAKECYPSDEGFGNIGWSYGLITDAEERYDWLKLRIADRLNRKDAILRGTE